MNLAVEWGELAHAPRLKVGEQDFTFLDFVEEARFLAEAEHDHYRPMLVTALKTGLRLGELLALRWEDVDLQNGRIIVRRNLWQDQEGTPKGGRRREVPLSDLALATLKALRGLRHLKGGRVFLGPDGEELTPSMVKDVVPRVCARAELAKRLTWHDLRHT